MKTDLKEILASLPDFDKLTELATKTREVSVKKLLLEKDIRRLEADIVRTATLDQQYFINGKPPAMSFIEATYKYTGFKNELLPLREEYARVIGELDELKLTMDIYKNMFDVWRTLSANERSLSL